MRTLALCAVLLMTPGCALLRTWFPPSSPWKGFKMAGPYARAGGVALVDHVERLRIAEEELSPELRERRAPGSEAFNTCLQRPEAYDVYVEFDETKRLYQVTLVPVAEVCLGDAADSLVGGGAVYELDAETFGVRRTTPLE